MSHPSRVRGLKHHFLSPLHHRLLSHPSRVRGLKLVIMYAFKWGKKVAPLAGAWIETEVLEAINWIIPVSHPSRVRGLKLKD